MSKHTEITTTTLVTEALRKADDFMTYEMLMAVTGRSYNQITAACYHLRNYHVVDVIIDPKGRGWWFIQPENEDQRSRTVEERVPESAPRRKRKYSPRKRKAKQESA